MYNIETTESLNLLKIDRAGLNLASTTFICVILGK